MVLQIISLSYEFGPAGNVGNFILSGLPGGMSAKVRRSRTPFKKNIFLSPLINRHRLCDALRGEERLDGVHDREVCQLPDQHVVPRPGTSCALCSVLSTEEECTEKHVEARELNIVDGTFWN